MTARRLLVSANGWLRFGGKMLFKTALVLLIAWLPGVFGMYRVGQLVHVLLLVGLMLLLIAGMKAREAAVRRTGSDSDPRRG